MASTGELTQLTYLERLKIALALSYGMLHLHRTPWIPQPITSEDIGFSGETSVPGTYIYRLDRPLLAKTLASASINPTQLPAQTALRPVDINTLSLGLLPIQIIVGRYIEDLVVTTEMSFDAILTKQRKALQMSAPVLEEGGMNYAEAVQWCLNSVKSIATLDDDEFGRSFHDAVITRLENDLKPQKMWTRAPP